jgi:hypothetical protein
MDIFWKLFRVIAEANFSLHFPKGPGSLEPPPSFVSRSFLREISVTDRPSPRHPPSTPPKRKDPRSTSKG